MAKTRSARTPSRESSPDAAGKKQKRSASKSSGKQASDVPKYTGKWFPTSATEEEVQLFKDQLLMPVDLTVWIPSGEVPPTPLEGERVLYQKYFERGLGFPLHSFVRRMLQFFGCQLHHIPPNGVLHITSFITFCEYFLGQLPTSSCFGFFLSVMCSDQRRGRLGPWGIYLVALPQLQVLPYQPPEVCSGVA